MFSDILKPEYSTLHIMVSTWLALIAGIIIDRYICGQVAFRIAPDCDKCCIKAFGRKGVK